MMASKKIMLLATAAGILILALGAAIALIISVMAPQQDRLVITPPPTRPPAASSPASVTTPPPIPDGKPAESRTAPFTGVRWAGDKPQVQVNRRWYDLIAFDGLPAEQIVAFAKDNYPGGNPGLPLWQKRLSEDLVDVLTKMNHPPLTTVSLDLRPLDGGDAINMPTVAMTVNNRKAIMAQSAGTNPNSSAASAREPANSSTQGTPFAAIRWRGETPEVSVQGAWYELVALDDVQAEQIVQYVKDHYPGNDPTGQPNWQRPLTLALGQMLSRMNHPLGKTVKLDLRRLDNGQTIIMTDVPVTTSNLESVTARANAQRGTMGATGTGAPFTAVRWMDTTPWVKVNGTWYEFLGVDDIPAETILSAAKARYPDSTFVGWYKRQFLQVFGTLLRNIGHAPGNTVKLSLRTLDTKEPVTLSDVPMSNENQVLSMQYMRSSPFTAVRWSGNTPQVEVNDTWYEFVSMDDHSLADLKSAPGDLGFASRETWMYAGWTPGDTVKLELRSIKTHDPVTLSDVPATPLNMEQVGLYNTRSPFTGVRWHDSTAEVEVNKTWYELVSIDQHPARSFALPPDRQLVDNLAYALSNMNDPVGDTVNLELKTLDTQQPVTMNDVPMTVENHHTVVGWIQAPGFSTNPSGLQAGPILGKVRWQDQTPQVQLSGTWYELTAIDDSPVADIIAFAQKQYGNDWQKNQFEDRTEKVMNQFGHNLFAPRNFIVTLHLKTLDTGESVEVIKSKPTFAPILSTQ